MRIENDKITDAIIMLHVFKGLCYCEAYCEIIAFRAIPKQYIIKSKNKPGGKVNMEDTATMLALPLVSFSDKHHKELLFLSLVHSITCAH